MRAIRRASVNFPAPRDLIGPTRSLDFERSWNSSTVAFEKSKRFCFRARCPLSSLHKARITNPRPILQCEVKPAGGVNLRYTHSAPLVVRLGSEHFPAQLNHRSLSHN